MILPWWIGFTLKWGCLEAWPTTTSLHFTMCGGMTSATLWISSLRFAPVVIWGSIGRSTGMSPWRPSRSGLSRFWKGWIICTCMIPASFTEISIAAMCLSMGILARWTLLLNHCFSFCNVFDRLTRWKKLWKMVLIFLFFY